MVVTPLILVQESARLVGRLQRSIACRYFAALLALFVSTAAFAGDLEAGKALYEKDDYTKAYLLLEKAAKAGNADAQFMVGNLYLWGEGTSKNARTAAQWYRKSAAQGHVKAQSNLAILYENGDGVKRDYQQAIRLYSAAAEQGNAVAMSNLAYMYLEGVGMPKNEAKAFNLYKQSAELGFPEAMNNVGVAYRKGLGGAKDEEKAMYWYRQAAAKGSLNAQESLCGITFQAEKWDEAYGWCLMAEPKSEGSLTPFALGIIYLMDKGNHEVDNKKAFDYLSIAAQRGRPAAYHGLASMYDFGLYVNADQKKAIELYQKAADGGVVSAQRRLQELK